MLLLAPLYAGWENYTFYIPNENASLAPKPKEKKAAREKWQDHPTSTYSAIQAQRLHGHCWNAML